MYSDTPVEKAKAILHEITQSACSAAANLAEQTQRILAHTVSANKEGIQLGAEQRQQLQAPIQAILHDHPWCNGAGFASYSNAQAGEEVWSLEWWYQEAGAIEHAQLDRNQEIRKRLDFRVFDWFGQPANDHQAYVDGPYVDYVCNGDYTITTAHPVLVDGVFVGVAAVDMLVSTLDRLLAPLLAAINNPVVVVNADRRVVLSTAPGVRVGTLQRDGQPLEQGRILHLLEVPQASSALSAPASSQTLRFDSYSALSASLNL